MVQVLAEAVVQQKSSGRADDRITGPTFLGVFGLRGTQTIRYRATNYDREGVSKLECLSSQSSFCAARSEDPVNDDIDSEFSNWQRPWIGKAYGLFESRPDTIAGSNGMKQGTSDNLQTSCSSLSTITMP
jgi:hypothetical protein